MTLKAYIGLKFIWTIVVSIAVYLILFQFNVSDDKIEKLNTELAKQSDINEQILKLEPKDSLAKKELLASFEGSIQTLKIFDQEKGFYERNSHWFNFLFVIINVIVFDFLNEKIKKLKITENKDNDEFL